LNFAASPSQSQPASSFVALQHNQQRYHCLNISSPAALQSLNWD
jgi:hypothetical protein